MHPLHRLTPLLLAAGLLGQAGLAWPARWRGHEGNSPGWRWLSPAERVEHQRRIRELATVADCKAYLDRHHRLLADRARKAGETFTARSPDTCDELHAQGQLR